MLPQIERCLINVNDLSVIGNHVGCKSPAERLLHIKDLALVLLLVTIRVIRLAE